MNSISIRQANTDDFSELTEIWLDASLKAHDFIPASYWQSHKLAMQHSYLPIAEVYLAENTGTILGFIALMQDKIAALFVSPQKQGQGVGTLLINYAKAMRSELELGVYQQNQNSVRFYQSVGFKIIKEMTDVETNTQELLMRWEK